MADSTIGAGVQMHNNYRHSEAYAPAKGPTFTGTAVFESAKIGESAVETVAGSQAKVAAHAAELDPHPQYANDTDLVAFDYEGSAESGAVTLTTALTDIVSLDMGSVVSGQRYFVSAAIIDALKGGTGGVTRIIVVKSSGTATFVFKKSAAMLAQSAYFTAALGNLSLDVCGIMAITVSGTLVIKLQGISSGSDTAVGSGEGQIYAARQL